MPQYPSVVDDASGALLTNYIGVASFTALVWDHIDTFVEEVEYIWKGKKGIFIYLFLFNRYFTPLNFIINLHAFISPVWTAEVRLTFTSSLGSQSESLTVSFSTHLGVWPLHKTYITIILSLILIIETIVNLWLIIFAHRVIHNPKSGVTSCSNVFDNEKPGIAVLGPASAWIPLMYDTVVFALTLYRTVPPLRNATNTSTIIRRLFEDGLLYYTVILAVTLVLTTMLIKSPEGIRQIAAQTEQLITVAMMSRITLNLRKAARQRHTRFLNSSEETPKSGFWLYRFLPALRSGGDNSWLSATHMQLNPSTIDGAVSDLRINNEFQQAHNRAQRSSFDV
ncbi:hypothetical protein Agabi119p4_10051 [Agaricus bisporus var. burnettii]|uniref:DUF6533 domain-containing protein n=1 Tax=Agaricus bisporus var. burnettii TaxID=192524 RepID=A0A8H7C1L8_AGABI|nr:hypothetical protein Agabi119p4_10051 [Agaricus bisporus var. burnettii]